MRSGPTNALLTASGERSRQYTAGIACGVLAMVAGLLAPALRNSFVTAFSGRFTFGALITFVVTVSGVQVLDLGPAFWGLVVGFGTSWLLERANFRGSRTPASA